MLGHAGFFTRLPKPALDGMIDIVKGVEPNKGYGAIMSVSQAEAAMRQSRIRRTKTVCTYRSEGIRETTPDTFVEVSPELALERGIQSGAWGQLVSRYGQVRVRAVVTDRVQGKQLCMPMNSSQSPVNRLTSSHVDPVTHTPAYKETSVAMRVLAEQGENPLPRGNHRFGHPTPQKGVEVERKWKRPDYRMPGTGPPQNQATTKSENGD